MIPLADEEEVHAFMKAVYPGFSDLALSVFSEKIALREATELITRLRSDLDAITKEREAARGFTLAWVNKWKDLLPMQAEKTLRRVCEPKPAPQTTPNGEDNVLGFS